MNGTSVQQIDAWLSSPSEHQRLEFKEAKNQFDNEKLYRYCVAIANEGGGHFLLGVSDARPRQVVGSQAFNNPVEMAEKLFRAVSFRVDIEDVAHPDGRVVVFHIPTRPRGTAYSYEGAYLMRVGESLTPMSEDYLRGIFAEGQPDWLEMPAKDGLSAQDVVELLDTQTFFELLKLPYPSDRTGVLDIRACYQHCVLKWVQRQPMSNQTLRERFKLSERSTGTISAILTATIEANFIKPDPAAPSGKKFARYLPIWA